MDNATFQPLLAIGLPKRYGKNYFGCYALTALSDLQSDDIDDTSMGIIYEAFEKDLLLTGKSIALDEFKRDDLSEAMLMQRDKRKESQKESAIENNQISQVSADFLTKLKSELESSTNMYAMSKTISHYLLSQEMDIPYFRVITCIDGKCKEAFPFANSTFNELVNTKSQPKKSVTSQGDIEYLEFEESVFVKEIEKIYPVFIIDRTKEKGVEAVRYIDKFTFSAFRESAKEAYDLTCIAFAEGDETKFPRTSSKLGFHIRPKAVNADDTFEFTNGEFITKRTFWANKETVEEIIQTHQHDWIKSSEDEGFIAKEMTSANSST
ncbi:hypothetical protein LJC07_02780 [Christensenellaceae bacterium OttesenSCG-928-L17]|nr:hypothetical protein [Christensenellaceae bacterium OttesenSCG-928-L17]